VNDYGWHFFKMLFLNKRCRKAASTKTIHH